MSILSQSAIAGYAQSAGLSGNAITIASSIAMAESRGQTDIINPGTISVPEYSVGLWQINLRAHPQYTENDMKQPAKNAAAMYAISLKGTNWNPWSTYTNGSYLQYMSNTGTQTPLQSVNTLTVGYQTTSSKGNPDVSSASGSGYVYILAYGVAIVLFMIVGQTKVGYRAIYYGLCLCVMFLVVTQSQFITNALQPLVPKSNSIV